MPFCLSKYLDHTNKAGKKAVSVSFSWSQTIDWKVLTFKYGVAFCLLSVIVSGFSFAKTTRLAEPKGKNHTHWQEHFERSFGTISDYEEEIESEGNDLLPLTTVDFQPNF